jgi:elongator complex protein 3
MIDNESWYKAREYTSEQLSLAIAILEEVRSGQEVSSAVRRHPLPDGGYLAKHVLVAAYRERLSHGGWSPDPGLLARIRMKPVRTLSGVTTVTVLTKPYPCPGECIFCPTDVRMPKSYVPDEPGARRALEHNFDPFAQVDARMEALRAVGHPTDKIELLILGGTWTSYRRDYQKWFIRRCFEALNQRAAGSLEEAFMTNEVSRHRNVGLVIETRPDHINPRTLAWLRHLGVTKVQMGAQSLDDRILEMNRRGHTAQQTRQAIDYLRAAGFKIVLHWMPNLLGASLESDRQDFVRLWDGFCPDELKIYPNQLLESAELYQYWLRGEYQPYTTEELVDLLAKIKTSIPRYCRVNRVIRDIPSTYVVEGNKRTSLRQDVHQEMKRRGWRCQCVRCREIRGHEIDPGDLQTEQVSYQSGAIENHFLSYVTTEDRLVGFLRLALPGPGAPGTGMDDLDQAAIIREVHVYGQSLQVGAEVEGIAQHSGLGTHLIEWAENLASEAGYPKLAVIAAVGTHQYYLERGFERGSLYLVKNLT